MNVARLVASLVTDIADVLVALVAMRARALAHGIEQDMRSAMRTAQSGGVHLLAFASEFGWEAKPSGLLRREAWTCSMIEHELAVVRGFEEGHVPGGPIKT
jgi:hypothetical protein